MLLKELEEARGRVVRSDDDLNVSYTEVSSSSQIITDNLITFRWETMKDYLEYLLIV